MVEEAYPPSPFVSSHSLEIASLQFRQMSGPKEIMFHIAVGQELASCLVLNAIQIQRAGDQLLPYDYNKGVLV
jgi:hypothetical protein